MTQRDESIQQAATDASRSLGFPVSSGDIEALIDLGILPVVSSGSLLDVCVRSEDACRVAAQVHTLVQIGGLFDETPSLFPRSGSAKKRMTQPAHRGRKSNSKNVIFLGLAPSIGISYRPSEIPAEAVQIFISMLRHESTTTLLSLTAPLVGPPVPVELDPHATLWVSSDGKQELLRSLWVRSVRRDSATSFIEGLATAKIYGNKSRLTSFIVAVAGLYLPRGSNICDLMSGTGIASLRLANDFHVYSNDANPFAAHLTRSRSIFLSDDRVSATLEIVRREYDQNSRVLRDYFSGPLEKEAAFLHGLITTERLDQYREFCASFPPPCPSDIPKQESDEDPTSRVRELVRQRRTDPYALPYCLSTAYFANAYIGLAQAIAVDGIRVGIDACVSQQERDLCLAALLLAVSSCGSGPHFAQPPKLHTLAAMKEVVEHRARDIFSEFAMIFRLLASRPAPTFAIEEVWNGDWRIALNNFETTTFNDSVQVKGVYIDPPYSKLQFSRYYHVLNTLLRYNYPPCEGVGRYPPRSERFSSKFEFQAASAAREFQELFDTCVRLRLVTLVSYSNRGFVPMTDLTRLMEQRFRSVHVYAKPLRHHSQGKPLQADRKAVYEYIVVGVP